MQSYQNRKKPGAFEDGKAARGANVVNEGLGGGRVWREARETGRGQTNLV